MATVTTKTCATCPSFVPVGETSQFFGRGTGTAMCARFTTPLWNPKSSDSERQATMAKIAENCSSHGQFRPTQPLNTSGLNIGSPDLDHMVETDQASSAWRSVDTCMACSHLVSETRVETELGWTSSLCKARGRLILANRGVTEARNCLYRSIGVRAASTDGVIIWPMYDSGGFSTNVVNPISTSTEVSAPPISDERAVTDADKAKGITGWRKIVNPDDPTLWTFLPVFDPEFFDEAERAMIPQSGDKEHPELYEDHSGLTYAAAVLWTELDETPALWGEPGTGKTEFARHIAWLMGLPFHRIPISASVELDDLQGKMRFVAGEGTSFQKGRVTKAWTQPCVLLIDEPNTGRPDVWQFLRPMLDNSKALTLDVDDGQRLDRDDNCYPVLAMNPAWDPRNRGAEEIADADASRLMHIFFELPDEAQERSIIARRVAAEDGWTPTEEQLKMVMGIAGEVRALCKDHTISVSWGLRPQIQVTRALRWFPPVIAYRRAVADYMEPDEAEALLAVVRAHVPPTRSRAFP